MKRLSHKRGAGGGGGGMGMMMPLLILVLIIALMMCQKDKKKEQPPKQQQQLPVPPTPSSNVSNACIDDGFYACDQCQGEVIDLPAGTNKVCCDVPCEGCPEIIIPLCTNGTLQPFQDDQGCELWKCVEGNQSLTCAFQKGAACKDTENCPDKQWIAASDTQRCCKIHCKARVQTTLIYPELGTVVIERFGAGKFGVYYGDGAKLGNIDIGKANYADALAKGNNLYEFTANKKQYAFKITNETETEIGAESAQPSPVCTTDAQCKLGKVNGVCMCGYASAIGEECKFLLDVSCVCDGTCKGYGTLISQCLNKPDGTTCGDVRICKNNQCIFPEEKNDQEAKAYLLGKYNPGICFGMPRVITETERTLVMKPDVVTYVRQRFSVTSDNDIYTKIVQLLGITIRGDAFTFRDGKCCTITTYEGKIKIDGSTIQDEVVKQDAQNVPC